MVSHNAPQTPDCPTHLEDINHLALRFLALPHASVAGYEAARATQRDRWLGGMRKFRRLMVGERGRPV